MIKLKPKIEHHPALPLFAHLFDIIESLEAILPEYDKLIHQSGGHHPPDIPQILPLLRWQIRHTHDQFYDHAVTLLQQMDIGGDDT